MQLIALENTFNTVYLVKYFPIPEYIDIDYNFLNGPGPSWLVRITLKILSSAWQPQTFWDISSPYSERPHHLWLSLIFYSSETKCVLKWICDLDHKIVSNDIAFAKSLLSQSAPARVQRVIRR